MYRRVSKLQLNNTDIPHIDTKTSCIDIKGKAILIKFFEHERDYAYKLFEDVRTRLANNAVADYKIFAAKKAELEDCGISVLLSCNFDTRRYIFGEQGTTCLDDNGNPQKRSRGCMTHISILAVVFVYSYYVVFCKKIATLLYNKCY